MKMKAAIVGLGKQTQKFHLPGILGSENTELVAVCDIDKSKVAQISENLGVRGYTSIDELFRNEDLNFVVVSTPHDTHLEIIRKAAENGINILKEKPFAKNLDEARQIIEVLKGKDVELMVTLQRRFSSVYSRFFHYIDKIGEPSFIDVKYNIFAKEPHPDWRGKRENAGGGCILDMGYHMVDLLVWYFGLPSNVYASYSTISKDELDTDVEDSASIVFEYGDSCSGNMMLSRFCPPKNEYIKIIGLKGVLEIFKDRINLFNSDGILMESFIAKIPSGLSASKQIDYFCKILKKEVPNASDPIVNLNHMLFIEACYRSKQEKKSINPNSLFSLSKKIKIAR
jgi:predicted dehydrogenase